MPKNYIKIQNHGFQPDKIEPDHYVLGAKKLPEEIISPYGQYDKFLPVKEIQRKYGLETMNCSNYGTHNAIETYLKAKYGIEENECERYSGVISETTQRGNSPHKVAEAIRKMGCIPEVLLPFSPDIDTWSEYYSPKPMTQNFLDIGKQWLDKYNFGHEWVYIPQIPKLSIADKQRLLMKALQYSPLGISVYAWKYRNGYFWKNPNDKDNHWVCLYGYAKGKYWKIFDSYDNTHKKLEWNYNFMFTKRYYLKLKDSSQEDEESKKKMDRPRLNFKYHQWLMRGWIESEDGSGYLNHDEDFVDSEMGKSPERWKLIRGINFLRRFGLIKLFEKGNKFGNWLSGLK